MLPVIDYKDHELHVQHCKGSDQVEINYRDEGKLHAMERDVSEPLEKTLIRISRNFQKKEKKKKKGGSSPSKKFSHENATAGAGVGVGVSGVWLRRADGCLAYDLSELTNSHWETGMSVHIKEDLSLTVICNAPVVVSIDIFPKKYARVNNFIVPLITHQFTTGVQFSWFAKSEVESDYHFVSEDEMFCPSAELVGCSLKLYCTPYRTESEPGTTTPARVYGRTVVQYLSRALEPETALSKALECRHKYLQDIISIPTTALAPALRLVSFNILARGYVQNTYALSSMYDYLENQEVHLSDEYRLQFVIKELLAYRGDVMCLQEVDESAYNKYLQPILGQHGYLSHHTTKNGTTVEGCATFIAATTFNVFHTVDVSLRDVMATHSDVPGSYLHKLCQHKPEVYEILTKKITTIAQISILRYKHLPHHFCLVVNTHLFYHPDAAYIRLLQIHEIMQQMDLLKTGLLACSGHEDAETRLQLFINSLSTAGDQQNAAEGVVIQTDESLEAVLRRCAINDEDTFASDQNKTSNHSDVNFEVSCFVLGDLNSTPTTGAMQYLERGIIDPSHRSWSSFEHFTWGGTASGSNGISRSKISDSGSSNAKEGQAYEGPLPRLTHKLNLMSAAGYPEYTNYTKTFKDLLDYIYVEKDKYDVVNVAPFPSEEVLSANCAIPSEVFPSDHLALVVDLQLKQ